MGRKNQGIDNKITIKLTEDQTEFLHSYIRSLYDMFPEAPRATMSTAIRDAITVFEMYLKFSPVLERAAFELVKMSDKLKAAGYQEDGEEIYSTTKLMFMACANNFVLGIHLPDERGCAFFPENVKKSDIKKRKGHYVIEWVDE